MITKYVLWCAGGYLGTYPNTEELETYINYLRRHRKALTKNLSVEVVITIRKTYKLK
jgi:hypothetical protein